MERTNFKSAYTTSSAVLTLITFVVTPFLTLFVATMLATIGAFLFSKQKSVKCITLAATIGFNIFTSATIGFPVRYSYPMAGEVHDKLTGAPVENAIFECRWIGREELLIGSHAGFDIDKTYAITDKRGRYFLKGRWTFDLFYPAVNRYVTLRHPLYAPLSDIDLKWDKLNEGDIKTQQKKGIIPYNIKLLKLDDKYKTIKTLKEAVRADSDFIEANNYSDLLLKIKPPPNIDWAEIFKAWESFMSKWPENFVKEIALERIAKTKNKNTH